MIHTIPPIKLTLYPTQFEVNGIPYCLHPSRHLPGSVSYSPVLIESREGFKGRKWAICYQGFIFTKKGKWEWEPIPSSRSDAFLKRARFDTVALALAQIEKAKTLDIRGTKV